MSITIVNKKYFLFLFVLGILGSCYQVHSQVITTIAGYDTIKGYSGDGGPALHAQFNTPQGMAIDSRGNLYVADVFNNCVRKIAQSGIITTFAGTSIAGYSGDGGPATHAKLNQPTYVAVDGGDNVYISDSRNSRIRKVNTEGTISTYAGTGFQGYWGDRGPATAAELSSPEGLAFDDSGNLYIADLLNLRIRKVTPAGMITTVTGRGMPGSTGDGGPASAALLDKPYSVCVDHRGNIFIADHFDNRIRKIDGKTGIISTYAGSGGVGLAGGFSGDGGPATNASLFYPTDVKCDDTGNIFIADMNTFRVRKVDTSGLITTLAGNGVEDHGGDGGLAIDAQFDQPFGLAIDHSGNIYVSETNGQNNVNDIRYVYLSNPGSISLTIYPNPTFDGQVNVFFASHYEENVKIGVYNMAGRLQISTNAPTNKLVTLNIEPAGYYFIKGVSAHGVWKGPISVAH